MYRFQNQNTQHSTLKTFSQNHNQQQQQNCNISLFTLHLAIKHHNLIPSLRVPNHSCIVVLIPFRRFLQLLSSFHRVLSHLSHFAISPSQSHERALHIHHPKHLLLRTNRGKEIRHIGICFKKHRKTQRPLISSSRRASHERNWTNRIRIGSWMCHQKINRKRKLNTYRLKSGIHSLKIT